MQRGTSNEYRSARNAVMRSASTGEVPQHERVNLQRAAVRLAEEVLIDLAVRAERRRVRRQRRA